MHSIKINKLQQYLRFFTRIPADPRVEPGEYKLTADFKKWVIEVAVDQINKHSDLTVSYKPQKTGRAITDFAFKIKDKDRKPKATGTASDQAMREKLEKDYGQQRIIEDDQEEF